MLKCTYTSYIKSALGCIIVCFCFGIGRLSSQFQMDASSCLHDGPIRRMSNGFEDECIEFSDRRIVSSCLKADFKCVCSYPALAFLVSMKACLA